VFCYGFPVLPVGQSDIPCTNTVKIFCSKCEDIYFPKSSRHSSLDGAYFGTSFPHLFLQTYPELQGSEPTQRYVPRIFGFRLHRPDKPRSISVGRDAAIENARKTTQEQKETQQEKVPPQPSLSSSSDPQVKGGGSNEENQ
jgi:hypothetical protein